MKITVDLTPARDAISQPSEVEIYFNKENLKYLVRELSRLKEKGDQAYFMTSSWGMDDLSEEKQVDANILIHHLRMTLI